MERIGEEIRRELGRVGPGGSIAGVVAAWPAAVGDEVARNAWPSRVSRDSTLVVNTASSAWAFELTQLQSVVLEQLVAVLGEGAPRALRFVPGPLPEPPAPAAEPARPQPLEPSPDSLAAAAELTSEIADDDLRTRIARAAALSLERARDDRRF